MADTALSFTGKVTGIEESVAGAWRRVESKRYTLRPQLDTSRFGIRQLTDDVGKFDKSLDNSTRRFTSFAAAASVFVGIQRSFASFVRATIEVEQSLARINVNLNQSGSGLKRFSKDLFDVARQTGSSFEDAAKSAEEFARQGLSVQETVKRTRDALVLARIAAIDQTDATQELTAAVNTFQKEALTTTDIVNRLAAVDTRFAVSSRDLGLAISRVGNTAQEAGVSFNQLLGIVTAVQQTTQVGGAKIGNALKTIFTKISNPESLNQLQQLGVVTRDVANNLLPATTILKNLSDRYEELGQSQKFQISQQLGGIYQINILKAAVADLSKEYGVYTQAVDTANNAQDAAAQKNEQLNKTLQASINATAVSIKELFSAVGSDKGGGILKAMLDQFQELRRYLSGDTGSELGKFLGDGIVKGLSNVITGPVAIALVFGIGTAFKRVLSSISAAAREELGLKSVSEQREAVLRRINEVLSQATNAEAKQIALAGNLLAQKEAILLVSERIAAADARAAANNAALAGSFLEGGRASPRLYRRAAEGYLPGVPSLLAESNAISKGTGGVSPSAKPVVIPNFAFGNGRYGPMVANTGEHIVPNFANGGSAILNPSMIRAIGGLPANARPINRAEGFIPNFAGPVGLRRGAYSIGEGTFARALKSPDANILFKAFKGDPDQSNLIRSEYAISKLAEELGLPVAKVYGSAKRSVARGGLYKEYVEGTLGSQLPASTNGLTTAYLKKLFEGAGIEPNDLRGANYIVRKGANLNDLGDVARNAVVVDPGFFENLNGGAARAYNKHYHSAAGGYLPNLAAAMSREAAAGVSPSSIYVDADSRLKSSGNPLGLLVANRRDEPHGGYQGVNRVLNQGGNPRAAGAAGGYVPNFARYTNAGYQSDDYLRFLQGNTSQPPEVQSQVSQAVAQRRQELDRQRAADVERAFQLLEKEKALAAAKRTLTEKEIAQSEVASRAVQGIYQDARARGRGLTGRLNQISSAQSAPIYYGATGDAGNVTPNEGPTLEEKRALAGTVPRQSRSDYGAPIGPSYRRFIGVQKAQIQTRFEASQRRRALQVDALLKQKDRGAQRLQNAGIIASFAAPLAAGFIPEGTGGTVGGVASGATSGALNGAGIGAILGPVGIGIGAGVGALIGAFNKATKSVSEFSEELAQQSSDERKRLDQIGEFIQIQNSYNEALSNGNIEAARKIGANRDTFLRNASPETANAIRGAGFDQKALVDSLKKFSDDFAKSETRRNAELGVKQVVSSFFGGSAKDIASASRGVASLANNQGVNLANADTQFESLASRQKRVGRLNDSGVIPISEQDRTKLQGIIEQLGLSAKVTASNFDDLAAVINQAKDAQASQTNDVNRSSKSLKEFEANAINVIQALRRAAVGDFRAQVGFQGRADRRAISLSSDLDVFRGMATTSQNIGLSGRAEIQKTLDESSGQTRAIEQGLKDSLRELLKGSSFGNLNADQRTRAFGSDTGVDELTSIANAALPGSEEIKRLQQQYADALEKLSIATDESVKTIKYKTEQEQRVAEVIRRQSSFSNYSGSEGSRVGSALGVLDPRVNTSLPIGARKRLQDQAVLGLYNQGNSLGANTDALNPLAKQAGARVNLSNSLESFESILRGFPILAQARLRDNNGEINAGLIQSANRTLSGSSDPRERAISRYISDNLAAQNANVGNSLSAPGRISATLSGGANGIGDIDKLAQRQIDAAKTLQESLAAFNKQPTDFSLNLNSKVEVVLQGVEKFYSKEEALKFNQSIQTQIQSIAQEIYKIKGTPQPPSAKSIAP